MKIQYNFVDATLSNQYENSLQTYDIGLSFTD